MDNVITPHNAKTKVCPSPNMLATNHIYCVAENCMAWRWARSEGHPQKRPDEKGYCGLAGPT
jgi:hypothetical protein